MTELFERRLLGMKSITPGTGKSFLQFKFILSILFAICLAHELLYSYFTVKYFREQITPATTRSGIQVLRTHAHFFTLSGIWSGVCLLIGLWAIIAEHIGFILGYAFMAFGGLVFQFMGSISSRDLTVVKLTAIGSIHEPILILVSLLFAHTINSSTSKLSTSPIYRRTVIESRNSSISDLFTSPDRQQSIRDSNWIITSGGQGTSSTRTSGGRGSRGTGSNLTNNNLPNVSSAYNLAFIHGDT